MTATSLSAIRDSAAVTSTRVMTAGPVRFFSQLTMSSACLPASIQQKSQQLMNLLHRHQKFNIHSVQISTSHVSEFLGHYKSMNSLKFEREKKRLSWFWQLEINLTTILTLQPLREPTSSCEMFYCGQTENTQGWQKLKNVHGVKVLKHSESRRKNKKMLTVHFHISETDTVRWHKSG